MFNATVAGDTKKNSKPMDDELGFYFTPSWKRGLSTELGSRVANLGMQVFGGHGYYSWNMAWSKSLGRPE